MDPQFSNNSRFQHNLVPGKTYDLSAITAHSGHRKLSPKLVSIAVQNFEVRLPLRCISPLLLLCNCYCCHDPFIVRSAQTCPPSTGFTQLTHPSRCSRSTLTTVCFCAADSSRDHVWSLCMCRGCSPLHLVKECGIHCQKNTNPANLQRCCNTEAGTGFVPASAQFFAVSTFLILKSPSWTRSCIQKYRVAMCFVRCPAPNRSVREFAVELSLSISIFIGIPKSWYIDLKDSPI